MATWRKNRSDFLKLGDHNAACSMCGRKRKASEMQKNWQGLYRCPEHNEPRQPQDFVRGVKDDQSVSFSQPEIDTFVQTGLCTIYQVTAWPNMAGPGCSIPGKTFPLPITFPPE